MQAVSFVFLAVLFDAICRVVKVLEVVPLRVEHLQIGTMKQTVVLVKVGVVFQVVVLGHSKTVVAVHPVRHMKVILT